jgi:hypothetical protein
VPLVRAQRQARRHADFGAERGHGGLILRAMDEQRGRASPRKKRTSAAV